MGNFTLKRPTLILCAGVNAGGKTRLSRRLVEDLADSLIVDKDTLARGMLRMKNSDSSIPHALGESHPMASDHYDQHVKDQSYGLLLTLAQDNLELGKHPVIDSPYVKEIQTDYFDNVLFPITKGPIKIIYCHAPAVVILERMIDRNVERDNDTLESLEAWDRFLEDQPLLPKQLEQYDHLKLDTSQGDDNSHMEIVRQYLQGN